MLKHLFIKNYALIDVLDIDFHSGFSVITGETGAGKSIILGAIGLLLGQRADSKAVKSNAQKCTIEARFDISRYDMNWWFEEHDLDNDGDECIIRRELTQAGKSRAFINDTPAPLLLMRELGEMLVDVHSQHQNLLLRKEDFQLNVIDLIAGNAQQRNDYKETFNLYRQAMTELKELKAKLEASRENEDFMRFQLSELESANIVSGEQALLEEEQEVATHTEDIKTHLYEASNLLNSDDGGVLSLLRAVNLKIDSAAKLYLGVSDLAERVDSALIELKDIGKETEIAADNIDFNPERLEYINDRLNVIYTLQRKFHKNSEDELLEELNRIKTSIDNIDHGDDIINQLEEKVNQLYVQAQQKAEILSETRRKAKAIVGQSVVEYLSSLGMPKVVFEIEIKTDELTIKGQDRVSFLFSANQGVKPSPVAGVASGGETARVMLALKALISGAVKLPTIIFDEIDTGVSGRVAERMAEIMQQMGNSNRQVISITHLPQIAALGKWHYKVEKHDTPQGTISEMKILSRDERIDEIAQMLSGSDITDAARTNAVALIGNA